MQFPVKIINLNNHSDIFNYFEELISIYSIRNCFNLKMNNILIIIIIQELDLILIKLILKWEKSYF